MDVNIIRNDIHDFRDLYHYTRAQSGGKVVNVGLELAIT